MPEKNLVTRIMAYIEKFPDIDSPTVHDGLLIRKQHRIIDMLAETYLGSIGLPSSQIETLEAIFHQPAQFLTPAELAEIVFLTRSAMTSNLDSLQRKGYITRNPHPEDRRKIAVSLTPKGRALCEEQLPDRYRDFARITVGLTQEERKLLIGAYTKVQNILREMLKEAGL